MITAGELLHGTDEDVVVNLYLGLLGRWPDEAGYESHMAFIRGRPDRRAEAFGRIRASEEAGLRGLPVDPDMTPVPAERALATQMRLRTEWIRRELALRPPDAPAPAEAALLEEVAALRREMAALRQETEDRLAAQAAALAGDIPPAPALSPALSLGYVNDLLEVLRGEMLERIRRLELRTLASGSERE